MLQWYLLFLTLLKVCLYLCPGPNRPELNDLFLFAVTVCALLSLSDGHYLQPAAHPRLVG
jgi:hypothetical protein